MTDHYPALRGRAKSRLTWGGFLSATVFVLAMLFLMWLPVYWAEYQKEPEPSQAEILLCDAPDDGVQVCTEFRKELAGRIKPRQVM
ncbi:hypothetical protein [Chitiniphilus eburneus]|uniref:Uncharacterized protein n=1 Tax=Chitiniphilus eburneus TaxID=2571148 RepID=A0A4U0Q4H6_9NEIS|nr:hypothetical protein [Chitiniphilus eburneus]TJZ75610.1 hypothetical protein FAZ21_06765 [Chitiniphilus eburneus]